MKISYKPFFDLIKSRNIKKYSLQKSAGVSNDIIRHITKDKSVPLSALLKICEALDCGIDDIVVFEKMPSAN